MRNEGSPREEIRRQGSVQERRGPRRAFLGWEELKAQRWVDIVEVDIEVSSAHDHEAAIENAGARRIPTPLEEVKGSGVLENGTTLAGGGRTRLEDADRLLSGQHLFVPREIVRITTDTDLDETQTRGERERGTDEWEMHTALPLLIRAPLAQNELVMRSRGVTVLVSRFHSAPHAE